jgi:hypothetical protein
MKFLSCLIIVILALLIVSPAGALDRYAGFVGGLNFADLSTKLSTGGELETNLHVAFGVGAVMGFPLREKVYLQLEPKYLQKGGKLLQETPEEGSGQEPSPDLDFRFSFIEIPILAKITFGEQIKRYAFFGPTFGFLLSAEVDAEFDNQTFTADIKETSKKTDFGILLGTGASFPLGRGELFFDGRYSAGFANLSKGGTVQFKHGSEIRQKETSSRDEISTKGFQIMAGYLFSIGG